MDGKNFYCRGIWSICVIVMVSLLAAIEVSCTADEDTYLGVLSTVPADGASQVQLDTILTITFSEELNKDTINGESISIFDDNGKKVEGTSFSVDAAVLTVTLDHELDLQCCYYAVVTTAVRSMTGHHLENGYQWHFTTREGSWQDFELVNDGEWPWSATISMNKAGTSVVSWVQSIQGNYMVCAAIHDRSTGWKDKAVISCDVPGEPHSSYNCIDDQGNVFVTWGECRHTYHPFGTECDGWLARYSPESGWSEAELSDKSGRISWYGDGYAISVWKEASVGRLFYSLFSTGEGWREPEQIPGIPHIGVFSLITNLQGKSLLTYISYFPGKIQSIEFNRTTGWGSPHTIQDDGAWKGDMAIAMNTKGDVIITWRGCGYQNGETLWAARLSNDSWQAAVCIDDSAERINGYSIETAISENGDSMVIYDRTADDNGEQRRTISVVRYDHNKGWVEPEAVETTGKAHFPIISMDAHGNANAVWLKELQHEDYLSACTRRYRYDQGWGNELTLEDRSDYFQRTYIAGTDNGYAQVIMRCGSGLYSTLFY